MKYLSLIFFLVFLNCKKGNQEKVLAKNKSDSAMIINSTVKDDSTNVEVEKIENEPKIYYSEFLPPENVLVNNHPYLLPKKEFDKLYPKLDSIKNLLYECGNPLEWLDEDWMIKTYGLKTPNSYEYKDYDGYVTDLYVNKMKFITNKNKVLFDEAEMAKNILKIKSHRIFLTGKTTEKEFEKLFPNAQKREYNGTYVLGLDKNYESLFIFEFKNEKLVKIKLWWLLC